MTGQFGPKGDLTWQDSYIKLLAFTQPQDGSLPDASLEVNWTDFAYVQYVTNEQYLCNSLTILEALHRVGAKADRVIVFPDNWQPSTMSTCFTTKSSDLIYWKFGTRHLLTKVDGLEWKDDWFWGTRRSDLLGGFL